MYAAPSIQKLLDELERLPGVGPKSAQRIAYWILNADKATALRLSEAIAEVKETVRFCSRCFNYAEDDLCEICQSSKRDAGIICVVSEPRDIPPIERTAVYNGVYHMGRRPFPDGGHRPRRAAHRPAYEAPRIRRGARSGAGHEPQR